MTNCHCINIFSIINEIMIDLAWIENFIYLLLALSNPQFVLLVIKINFVPGDGKKFIGRVMQNIFWKLSLKAASKVEPAQVWAQLQLHSEHGQTGGKSAFERRKDSTTVNYIIDNCVWCKQGMFLMVVFDDSYLAIRYNNPRLKCWCWSWIHLVNEEYWDWATVGRLQLIISF